MEAVQAAATPLPPYVTEAQWAQLREDQQQIVIKAIAEIEDKNASINARVLKHMIPVHEDIVIIHRLDLAKYDTFLQVPADQLKVRQGTVGRVVSVATAESGDVIKETKKLAIAQDDYIVFNAESAYSLNLPGYQFDLWVISVENVLVKDDSINPAKIKVGALLRGFGVT